MKWPVRSTRRISISTKLNLLTIGVLLTTACSVGVAIMHMQGRSNLAALEHHAEDLARTLAQTSEALFYTGDRAALASRLDALAGNRDMAYAAFYGADGSLLNYRLYRSDVALPAAGSAGHDQTASGYRVIDVTWPVRPAASRADDSRLQDDGRSPELGHVRVGLSAESARRDALAFIMQAGRYVVVIGALAIAMTLLLTRRLVEPLRELAAAAKQVGAGRLGLKIPVHSNDELADLARAFQHMIDSLGASRARLLEYQSVLERRVEARTHDLKRATARALDLAQRDTLTGLANRAYFSESLAAAVADSSRFGEHMALLFIDLDQFKRVNDSLGHHVGDRLLSHVADVLRACVREGDLVARLGGDEFVVLAREVDSRADVEAVVRRLLTAIQRPIEVDGTLLRGGFSIGIALCPEHSGDAADLLRMADLAMYSAKQAGRGNHVFYTDELNERAVDRMRVETGLRRALARDDELYLVYQPQLDVANGHLSGCEALLRWRQPDGSLVPPASFIPVAEDSGLIFAIGDFVLTEVCQALARWRDAGYELPRVAVNVAAPQFEDPGFCERVARVLERHQIPPDRIELELTERLLMNDSNAARETMHRLKQLGVALALDDFGTGYSSLAYLSRLPLDVLKIDRSFVMASTSDPAAHTIVRSIVALAHSFGHDVVAEGVETGEQWRLLRRAGADYVQGYLFGPPLAEAAFSEWVRGPRACVPPRPRIEERAEALA